MMSYKIDLALQIFKDWNFRYDLEERAAVFLAWEFWIGSYLDCINVRRAVSSNIIIENFIFKEIKKWNEETTTINEICQLEQWKSKGQ